MTTTFNYQEYLASREWALLKNQVRDRCGGLCERCHEAPYQATHHLTYERIGHEELADLLGVCNACHDYLSGKSNDDPAEPRSIAMVGTPAIASTLPIRINLNPYNPDAAGMLECPACGLDYIHIVGGAERSSNDDYANGWVRGDVLQIHCYCENSHHFSIEFGFHKGQTYVRYSPDWGTYWPDNSACKDCANLR